MDLSFQLFIYYKSLTGQLDKIIICKKRWKHHIHGSLTLELIIGKFSHSLTPTRKISFGFTGFSDIKIAACDLDSLLNEFLWDLNRMSELCDLVNDLERRSVTLEMLVLCNPLQAGIIITIIIAKKAVYLKITFEFLELLTTSTSFTYFIKHSIQLQ